MSRAPFLSFRELRYPQPERIYFGVMLLATGLLKVTDLRHFQAMLSRYAVVPPSALPWFTPLLGWLEVLLGLALLSGWRRQRALLGCEVLFYAFAAAIGSVLARGLRINCGCFGVWSVPLSWGHLLLVLCLAVWLTGRRLHSSHRRPKAA